MGDTGIRLLLTATIDVAPEMPFVGRRDSETRRQDYEAALRRWFALPRPVGITFCENSGADLESLRALAAGRDVEFLSYVAPRSEAERGKGYAEMGILLETFDRSAKVSQADYVVKVTGRQFVPNFPDWVKTLEATPDLDVVCNLTNRLRYADARIFAGRPAFYRECLFPVREQIDDSNGIYFEGALARAAHLAMSRGMKWTLPPSFTEIVGPSGSENRVSPEQRTALRRWAEKAKHRVKRRTFGATDP